MEQSQAAFPSVLLFDAYGTLFDVGSVAEAVSELAPDPSALLQVWRTKQLEYTWLRALMGPAAYVDFWRVTSDALDFAAERVGVQLSPAAHEQAMAGWLRVRPFPEANAALERLGRSGLRKLAILSNGSPAMLRAAVRNAGFDGRFASLLSVDAVRSYKPDPRVYQMGVETFGGAPADFLFVSSNAWDAAGARAFGYRVAWLNRAAAPPERLGVSPDLVLPDLMALADALAEG
jgi:2-haloacid dehalogenase